MKLNKLFTLILFSMLLAGCTIDKVSELKVGIGESALRFELGGSASKELNTRAGGNNDQTSNKVAEDKEKVVTNVISLLFQEDDGKLFMKKDFILEDGNVGEPFVINISTIGVYNLYLIANADYDLKNKIMSLDGNATLETVGELLAEQAPDVENGFLMTSKSLYRFEATPGNVVEAGDIPLRRLSVRIDLVNAMNEADITSITFKNQAVKSNLITGNAMPENVFNNKTYDFSASPVKGDVKQPQSLEATIYTYENYSEKDNIPTLTITYTTKTGEDPKTHDIVFSDSKSDANAPLALKRNYLYRITLINDMSVKYDLEVLDWDIAETFTAEHLETKLQAQTFTKDPTHAWFEVDPNNVKVDINGIQTETMNWYIATGNHDDTFNPTDLNACPDGWKLPSHLELMMMWVYNDSKSLPHAGKGIFMYVGERMWAKDSYSENARAWSTSGTDGHTGAYAKDATDSKFVVRCIKDIVPGEHRYPYLENGIIVSKDANGGIEESALLTEAQIDYLNSTNIKETIYSANDPYNHVSPKFQVATNITANKKWDDAYGVCENYSEAGSNAGDWRLPTQRELMLMYIMSQQKDSGLSMRYYTWAGCSSGLQAWLSDSDGYITTRNKDGKTPPEPVLATVRCVRDIREAKVEKLE